MTCLSQSHRLQTCLIARNDMPVSEPRMTSLSQSHLWQTLFTTKPTWNCLGLKPCNPCVQLWETATVRLSPDTPSATRIPGTFCHTENNHSMRLRLRENSINAVYKNRCYISLDLHETYRRSAVKRHSSPAAKQVVHIVTTVILKPQSARHTPSCTTCDKSLQPNTLYKHAFALCYGTFWVAHSLL